jgi:hypothetical protein
MFRLVQLALVKRQTAKIIKTPRVAKAKSIIQIRRDRHCQIDVLRGLRVLPQLSGRNAHVKTQLAQDDPIPAFPT